MSERSKESALCHRQNSRFLASLGMTTGKDKDQGLLLPVKAHDLNQPLLKLVLGRFDLVLLFVVAVFNLNVVPSIAANGGVTVWLWIISLLLFFLREGVAVIELAP